MGIENLRLKKMGSQNHRPNEEFSFRERRLWKAQQSTQAFEHTEPSTHREKHNHNQESEEEDTSPMALSTATKEWFSKHGLDGFPRVVDAPPHDEPEKVTPTIDLEEIAEGTIHALVGLPAVGLRSIESPSTEILTEYFGEYSLRNKAYKTHGGEDPLFREVARVPKISSRFCHCNIRRS